MYERIYLLYISKIYFINGGKLWIILEIINLNYRYRENNWSKDREYFDDGANFSEMRKYSIKL